MNNRQWVDAMNLHQSRRNGLEKPEGSFDKKGRWIPYIKEMCECCLSVGYPSTNNPFLLLAHCRTRNHCYHLVAKRERIIKCAQMGVKLCD